jgi:hypothetical protein
MRVGGRRPHRAKIPQKHTSLDFIGTSGIGRISPHLFAAKTVVGCIVPHEPDLASWSFIQMTGIENTESVPAPRKRRKPQPPTGGDAVDAYSIAEFCRRHGGLSMDMFFKLQREGRGPQVMRVGRRTMITVEAARRWRRAREAAAAKS